MNISLLHLGLRIAMNKLKLLCMNQIDELQRADPSITNRQQEIELYIKFKEAPNRKDLIWQQKKNLKNCGLKMVTIVQNYSTFQP